VRFNMQQYDIIYFKGNPNSGTKEQHHQINTSIIEFIKEYNYLVLESEHKNLAQKIIPKAKVYIGFSRGSRYLKKLDNNSLKISIGGVMSSKVHLFKNPNDHILLGDVSDASLNAHFIIQEVDKLKIKALIKNFLL